MCIPDGQPVEIGRLYSVIGKGGLYTVKEISKGAGPLRGETFVTYKSLTGVETYVRTLDDFVARMERVYLSGNETDL